MTQGRLASTKYSAADGEPNYKGGDKDDSYSRFEWRWVDLRLDFDEWIAYRRWQSDNRETK